MHCPSCGQQQVSEETRFCSRCGFPLAGVAQVVANHGLVPAQQNGIAGSADSPKRRGIKQGAFLFLLTFLIVPIMIVISISLNLEPFLPLIAVFLCGVGGLLRVIYALMFESGASPSASALAPGALPVATEGRGALPPSPSTPASVYVSPAAGSWRDTNELQHEPASVTDSTTKLLQREDPDQ